MLIRKSSTTHTLYPAFHCFGGCGQEPGTTLCTVVTLKEEIHQWVSLVYLKERGGGLPVLSCPNCPRACHDSQTEDRRGKHTGQCVLDHRKPQDHSSHGVKTPTTNCIGMQCTHVTSRGQQRDRTEGGVLHTTFNRIVWS